MSDPKPTRHQGDLAEMLDTLLDKGVVINADIAVSVGDTELLGVKLRAAVASFETAAEYGLEFPSGTDMERVHEASRRETLPSDEGRSSETDEHEDPDPETDGGVTGDYTSPVFQDLSPMPEVELDEDYGGDS